MKISEDAGINLQIIGIMKIIIGAAILIILLGAVTPWGEKSSYFISETIPGKIVIVSAHGGRDLTWELDKGLKEVGKKYEIIAQTPIIGQHFFGSRTVALILSVEPK